LFVQASCEPPWRFADDGMQVVAALVRGDRRAAIIACLSRGSFVAAAAQPAAAAGARAGSDLRSARADRLGSAADRRYDRASARDGLADTEASGDLAAAEVSAGAGTPLRVALPR
jgi:hypothetical protein